MLVWTTTLSVVRSPNLALGHQSPLLIREVGKRDGNDSSPGSGPTAGGYLPCSVSYLLMAAVNITNMISDPSIRAPGRILS